MSGPRFSIIPAGAVTDPRFTGHELQVLAVLGRHTNNAGWCRRSQTRMAREIGCSRSTVQRNLDRLAEFGYVEIRPANDDVDTPHCSHFYRVRLDIGEPDPATDADVDDQERVPAGGQGCPPKTGTHIERPLRTNKREDASQSISDNDEADEDEFEDFFQDWPTSSGDNRAKAWRAWKGLSPGDRKSAAANAPAYVQHLKRDLRRKMLPASSTYLSERSWERLPASERASSSDVVALQQYTRTWWCHLHRTIAAGKSIKRMCSQAQAGSGFTVLSSELPDEDCESSMVAVMRGSEAQCAWSQYFRAQGIELPTPESCPVIFMPSERPPKGEPT